MIPFDARGAFRHIPESNKLRRLAIRGATATVFASGLALAVQVVSTVTLARLLTPSDFGVVTMVTTVSFFLANFGLNGFTEAVIQFEEMDHRTASNLYWLNSGAGLILAIAFIVAGPLLARFYSDPLVGNVATALSVGIFISASSVIHLALLKRAMNFVATSGIDLVGRGVNTVVSILLALRGWGYLALVAGIVAQQFSVTIGAWWLCRWIPSLPRPTGKTGATVRFAASVYSQFAVRYSTQNVDNLLVGWQFNPAALGLYKKAYDLFALSASQLTAPLNNVALATLSRLNQDPVRFRQYLANLLGVIAVVGMAQSGDLTLVGKDAVRLVLGPQWSESGRIFERFGAGIGAMLLCFPVTWMHLSMGKPGRLFRWSVVELTVTVFLFVVLLPYGPAGIAGAWSISYWVLLIPGFWYAGRPIGFGVSSLIAAVWRYVAASLVAGLVTGVVRGLVFPTAAASAAAALDRIMAISAVFLTLYLGFIIVAYRGCGPLHQIVSLMRELAPESRSPALQPSQTAKEGLDAADVAVVRNGPDLITFLVRPQTKS
jgi:O-antigen/teichoic acid export membrane protein